MDSLTNHYFGLTTFFVKVLSVPNLKYIFSNITSVFRKTWNNLYDFCKSLDT